MTQPLFDPEKCNIPEIPSLGFDFVSDCSVPAAPPPIFDCPPPDVPREPPPLCPEFSARVYVNANYTGCSDQSNSAAIVFTKIDDDPCRFFVDLDLNIRLPPPPCPTISVGDLSLTVEYADCLPTAMQGIALAITKEVIEPNCGSDSNRADSCKFTVDLTIGIPIPRPPCPEISVGEFSVTTDWEDCITKPSALTITRTVPEKKCLTDGGFSESACQFTLDLDLQIPIPRIPCPTFAVTGTIGYSDEPEVLLYAEVIKPDNTCTGATGPSEQKPCEIDFGIDILVPCPDLTATIDVTSITATAQPTGTLIIKPQEDPVTSATAPCKLEVELELKIPQPCIPTFWCSTRYSQPTDPPGDGPLDCSFIEILPANQEPYVNLTVKKEPNPFTPPPHECDYRVELDLGIPLPPCPELTATLNITAVTATVDPTGTLTFTPSGALNSTGPCQYNLGLGLKLPKPCIPTFWCSERYRRPGEPAPPVPPRYCSFIERLDASQEPYVNFEFEKAANPFTDPPGACDYRIGLDIGFPVTGVQIITDITCVNGEIIVTKETIEVMLPPPPDV